MKRENNKSRCPINLTVEIIGDTWSLLILRDMMALGKCTFGEFMDSAEQIGSSVLTDRLIHLERNGIILKKPSEQDKRKHIYQLTEKGLNFIPLLYEIASWGSLNLADTNAPEEWFKIMKHNREQVLQLWREALESGSSFFHGPDSVVIKLGLHR